MTTTWRNVSHRMSTWVRMAVLASGVLSTSMTFGQTPPKEESTELPYRIAAAPMTVPASLRVPGVPSAPATRPLDKQRFTSGGAAR